MRLISSESGQSLQLLVMDEIYPLRGGPFLPDMITSIMQRYRFVSTTPSEASQPIRTYKFQTGVIDLNNQKIPISSLEVYSDGIIVNARHTEDADKAMDDFISWTIAEFGLREPATKIPRTYQSRIVVELDRPLNRFVTQFEALRTILGKSFHADIAELNVLRLSIGPHPPGTLPYKSTWVIEPRTILPIVENRYFSAAPLSTQAHVEMLVALEAAIAHV